MIEQPKPSRLWRIGLPVLVFALAIAIYLPTVKFGFVVDDPRQIEMMSSRFTWSQVPGYFATDVWSYTERVPANYYRPIFVLWLMLNYQVFGLDHAMWHASTVLTNAIAGLLMYFLARKLTGSVVTAGIAALIFVADPVHVEGVAWVSGVTEPLWAILFFTTFLLFLKGREEPPHSRMVRWGALFFFALAMFSKETAAVVPVLIFFYVWLYPDPGRADESRAIRAKAALSAAIPYMQIVLVYFAMRLWALGGFSPIVGRWTSRALVESTPEAIWFYVRTLLWPFQLSIFPPLAAVVHPGRRDFFLPVIGIAAAAAVLLWISTRSRLAAFCSILMVLTIAPVFLLRAFALDDFVHDRYLYVPSAGFCILLSLAIQKLFGNWPNGARVALVAPLIAVLAYFTVRESQPWRSDVALAGHAIELAPDSIPSQALMADGLLLLDRHAEAAVWFRKILATRPEHRTDLNMDLGICELRLGHWPEAAEQFKIAIAASPKIPKLHMFLGMAELELGDVENAEAQMREALRLRPLISVQYRGYRSFLADLLQRKGDYQGALEQYRQELEEYPDEGWVLDRELALRKKMDSAR